ncbi:coiled-coil domain containing 89 [Nothobranchius furzeri]|uniref:Coiled-coil domain containing 89 n=2 Tax=Nothobranchius furzeri TaxID=105023 RepID=A0A9D2YAP4_NOTFU|nr:coiled-coil domain containing 89 [Nothobranchius furzeri]
MTVQQRKTENFIEVGHAKSIQMSPGNPETCAVENLANTLQSRIAEQSSLICMLKDRADKTLLQYQAQLKINANLEKHAANYQEKLDREQKKRSSDLVSSNKAMISLIEEHKNQNVQLKVEYERLQLETDSQFSQKLQEKESLVQKRTEDIELLKEKLTKSENEYRGKLAESESKLKEKVAQHQAKEASLLIKFSEAQQQQREAVETCEDLKLKLEKTKEQRALEEIGMRERIKNLIEENER